MRWLEGLKLSLKKWRVAVYNIVEIDKVFRNYYQSVAFINIMNNFEFLYRYPYNGGERRRLHFTDLFENDSTSKNYKNVNKEDEEKIIAELMLREWIIDQHIYAGRCIDMVGRVFVLRHHPD
jgi:hypothetical protein